MTAVEPSQFALFLNSAPVAGTLYGTEAGTQQNNGQAIINIVAETRNVLTLRNHSSATAVILKTLAGGHTNKRKCFSCYHKIKLV